MQAVGNAPRMELRIVPQNTFIGKTNHVFSYNINITGITAGAHVRDEADCK